MVGGILVFCAFSSAGAGARVPSVCERWSSRAALVAMAADPFQRMSFENDGGIAGGGVCWWHSRFQRAVWSLAEFRPDLPKPSHGDAVRIIRALAWLRDVQIIPGYSDFLSFSADYQNEIQRELNAWQLRDGLIGQSWIRAIWGTSDLSRRPKRMERIMNRLYRYSQRGEKENFFPWIMLQLKGFIGAHAALVTSMKPTRDGYELTVVDSNYPDESARWTYHYGDGRLGNSRYETVPYRGLHRDVTRMKRVLDARCSGRAAPPVNDDAFSDDDLFEEDGDGF